MALPPASRVPFTEELDPTALHGLAGRVARHLCRYPGCDPASVHFIFLTAFGNLVGRRPFWQVEATEHRLNLYTTIVGADRNANPNASCAAVEKLLHSVAPGYLKSHAGSGFRTGKALINRMRDARRTFRGRMIPGVHDKRLLWIEPYFSDRVRSMTRCGNTLASALHVAWESDVLMEHWANGRVMATDPHLSIIGLVEHDEAEKLGNQISKADYFTQRMCNRYLWVCAKSHQSINNNDNIADSADMIAQELQGICEWIDSEEFDRAMPIQRDQDATKRWAEIYRFLNSFERIEPIDTIIARSAPQIMRLAALYAILDRKQTINEEHLCAAIACWTYSEASVNYIFGQSPLMTSRGLRK